MSDCGTASTERAENGLRVLITFRQSRPLSLMKKDAMKSGLRLDGIVLDSKKEKIC